MPIPTPPDYRGRKIKAIPYDQNGRPSSVLVLPVVDVSGNIIGYLPPKVTDNGDGTASLSVTASVSIDPGDVEIGAVEIKDGTTDTRGKVRTDGTENALVITANVLPLPTGAATESTLQDILDALDIYVIGETPSGVVDGMNDTFTTFFTFKPGTTHLYLNGIRQKEGVGFDYVEEVDNQTITFATAPILGDTLLIDYTKL